MRANFFFSSGIWLLLITGGTVSLVKGLARTFPKSLRIGEHAGSLNCFRLTARGSPFTVRDAGF
jgi:hypothetical protein